MARRALSWPALPIGVRPDKTARPHAKSRRHGERLSVLLFRVSVSLREAVFSAIPRNFGDAGAHEILEFLLTRGNAFAQGHERDHLLAEDWVG